MEANENEEDDDDENEIDTDSGRSGAESVAADEAPGDASHPAALDEEDCQSYFSEDSDEEGGVSVLASEAQTEGYLETQASIWHPNHAATSHNPFQLLSLPMQAQ